MANSARRFATNWTMRDVFPLAKFPDLMGDSVSKAVTNTMMPAVSWKKPKAPETARYCTRSSTVTIRRASKLAIPSLMHPANSWAERALPRSDQVLLLSLERKAPGKRRHLASRKMPNYYIKQPVVVRLLACHSL